MNDDIQFHDDELEEPKVEDRTSQNKPLIDGKSIGEDGPDSTSEDLEASPVNNSGLKPRPKHLWRSPDPLVDTDVPDLPAGVFPYWLESFTRVHAQTLQVPRDLSVLFSLAAVSTAVNGLARVRRTTLHDEPLNLWVIGIQPPGARKSAMVRQYVKPIEDHQEARRTKIEEDRNDKLDRKAIYQKSIQKARNKAAKDPDNMEAHRATILQLQDRIDGLDIPAIPVLSVSDATPPRVLELLDEQDGILAFLSSEAEILKTMSGQRGAPLFGPFQKAWSHDAIRTEHVGKGEIEVPDPSLTIGLTVQPNVIRTLRNRQDFKAEGLMDRFLFAWPASRLGNREYNESKNHGVAGIQRGYNRFMTGLLELTSNHDRNGFGPLTVSDEAHRRWRRFATEVEQRMGEGGDLHPISGWASKLQGGCLRVAGVLHFADEVGSLQDPTERTIGAHYSTTISGRTMEAAVRLCEALIPHAKRVFDLVETDQETKLARYVLERLETVLSDQPNRMIRQRELFQKVKDKADIEDVQDLRRALRLLKEHNFVRLREPESKGPGRPPSPLVELNPHHLKNRSVDKQPDPAPTLF